MQLLVDITCVFSSLNDVLILLCIIFLTPIYVLPVTELTLWVAPPEMFCSWYRIEAETNCGISHILGILLMNSYNRYIF